MYPQGYAGRTLGTSTSSKELHCRLPWKPARSSAAVLTATHHDLCGQPSPALSHLARRSPFKSRGRNCSVFRGREPSWPHRCCLWSLAHRPCPVSQRGPLRSAEPLGDLVLQTGPAADWAGRGAGMPWTPGLPFPHLDCIALPHRQPIGASWGSAHVLPLATDIASCPCPLLEHAAPRAGCGGGVGGAGVGCAGGVRGQKERGGHQSHWVPAAPSPGPSSTTHAMWAPQSAAADRPGPLSVGRQVAGG